MSFWFYLRHDKHLQFQFQMIFSYLIPNYYGKKTWLNVTKEYFIPNWLWLKTDLWQLSGSLCKYLGPGTRIDSHRPPIIKKKLALSCIYLYIFLWHVFLYSTRCFIYYRKSVMHLHKRVFHVRLSRYSTDLR